MRFKAGNKFGGRKPNEARIQLEKAIAQWEETGGIKLFDHVMARMQVSDKILEVVLKKLLPDLKHVEGNMNTQVQFITKVLTERQAGWGRGELAETGHLAQLPGSVLPVEAITQDEGHIDTLGESD